MPPVLWDDVRGLGGIQQAVTGEPSETGGSRGPIADVSTIGRREVTPSAGEVGPGLAPALVIASHVVASRAGERLMLGGLRPGGPLELSRNSPDFARAGGGVARPLADPFVSRKPISLEAVAGGGISVVVPPDGMAVEANGEPVRGSR